jgi:F0F1-type ATP synthase assembly protein I
MDTSRSKSIEKALNGSDAVSNTAPQAKPARIDRIDAESKRVSAQVGPYLNLGMELFAAVAGFGIVGWYIDTKFGTAPVWMLVLLFLGAIGGMYNLIRAALKTAPPSPRHTARTRRSTGSEDSNSTAAAQPASPTEPTA